MFRSTCPRTTARRVFSAGGTNRAASFRRRRGFSLIEALIALSITALAGAVLLLSVESSLQTSTAAVEQTVAEGLDWAYGHAVYAAVSGAVEGQVLTATPEAYDGTGVWAVDIGKP